MKRVRRQKHATAKLRTNFRGVNNGPHPNDAGNYSGTSGKRRSATLPVGSLKSNSLGLYDLGGNAWDGVSTLIKATTAQVAAIWESRAAALGPHVIAWKCNLLTEM
jgi:formylglycine-generating enzyme required for sulfatase activity